MRKMKWPRCRLSTPPPTRWMIQATRMISRMATSTQNRVHSQRGRFVSIPASYPRAIGECGRARSGTRPPPPGALAGSYLGATMTGRACGRLRSPYPMPAGCARCWPTSTRELAWGRSCWRSWRAGMRAGQWDVGEFGDRNGLASVEAVDAASVLSGNWDLKVPDPDERDGEAAEMIAPFGWDCSDLARRRVSALSEGEAARALGWFKLARVDLVPASRPADVRAVIGLNDVNRDADPASLAAVLRSWEDRFWPPNRGPCATSSGRSTRPARRFGASRNCRAHR